MTPEFKIRGIDPDFHMPTIPENQLVSRWVETFSGNETHPYISNSTATTSVIASQTHAFPLLITAHEKTPQVWIHSQYTHFIRYAREELVKIPSATLQATLRAIINPLDWTAEHASIDRAVYLNHFGVSTNLWPAVSPRILFSASQHCAHVFPDRTVILRSLDPITCAAHISYLKNKGFVMVPSRIIYLLPTTPRPDTKDFRRDVRLFNDGQYTLLDGRSLSQKELIRCAELYTSLYVEKYSRHNPQYTVKFFQSTRDSELLSFKALERNGKIDGVIGTLHNNNTLTCPILGYDLSKPRSCGLYRRLTTAVYNAAVDAGCININRSSGVGKFKIARGAKATTEYSAIYCSHQPWKVRHFWKFLESICSRIAAPVIKHLEL